MRWLGLDLGEKRIGIAISDPLEITAQAHSFRARSTLREDLDFFKRFIAENQIEGIVIGLPVNMNGTRGPGAAKALFFGTELQKMTGKEPVYWDERLSTAAALQVLIAADVSRSKRREKVDKLAAVIILQNFLDARHRMNNG
jgi:putative Holliday junction resolvase